MNFRNDEIGICVSLSEVVVETLATQIQSSGKHERGGLLFARTDVDSHLVIEAATLPHQKDRSGLFHFRHNKKAAQKNIDQLHKQGLLYVGDWHSHPQVTPSPSYSDFRTSQKIFRKSEHSLYYMIMLIIGSTPDPHRWHISLVNAEAHYPLSPERY